MDDESDVYECVVNKMIWLSGDIGSVQTGDHMRQQLLNLTKTENCDF